MAADDTAGDFLTDCLLLSDDFAQYYLGATHRAQFVSPVGIDGDGPLDGVAADFGGPAVADNPLDEVGAFSLTSGELPAEDFPLFAAEATSTYRPPTLSMDGVIVMELIPSVVSRCA